MLNLLRLPSRGSLTLLAFAEYLVLRFSLKARPLSVFGSTACVFEVFPQHMWNGYWFSHGK